MQGIDRTQPRAVADRAGRGRVCVALYSGHRPDGIRRHRRGRSQPARPLAFAALASAVLVAACGASSPGPAAGTGGGTSGSTAGRGATTARSDTTRGSYSTARSAGAAGPALAFARCMRANGVSSFPDPSPGGGGRFDIPASVQASPAFNAAQTKCQKILSSGGLLPGHGAPASPQTMTKLVRIAGCMRAHGISGFPDPEATMPSRPPAGIRVITDYDGAILLFPTTLNMEAPAYRKALTACGAPPLGLPH